jgi:hypothetical protein
VRATNLFRDGTGRKTIGLSPYEQLENAEPCRLPQCRERRERVR